MRREGNLENLSSGQASGKKFAVSAILKYIKVWEGCTHYLNRGLTTKLDIQQAIRTYFTHVGKKYF